MVVDIILPILELVVVLVVDLQIAIPAEAVAVLILAEQVVKVALLQLKLEVMEQWVQAEAVHVILEVEKRAEPAALVVENFMVLNKLKMLLSIFFIV